MVVKHGEGEKKRRGAAEKKVISLFDQKNTSPFMYWQRWKAHGDGGSLARCMKRSKCWRLYHLFFWKHRRSLWHGKPFEDTNKKHIQDILWLLCSSSGVLLRGIESLKVFFFVPRPRKMTLAAHTHHVRWCPGPNRWCRKSLALYGKSGHYCPTGY